MRRTNERVEKLVAMYHIMQAIDRINNELPEDADRTVLGILLDGMESELAKMDEKPKELVYMICEHLILAKKH